MSLRQYTDMTGRKVEIPFPPQRIVSVVPSQTELLFDLGLDEEVVGITKFCVHPDEWFRTKARIGGTKQLHIDRIKELKPDLIIANKEENTKEQIEALASELPVWISDIKNIPDALQMIRTVGRIVGKELPASEMAGKIENGFAQFAKAGMPKRAAYFIWRGPWMTAGGDTFINNIIERIGWQNVFADKIRYPEVSLEELAKVGPEMVLLSSEPYPFKEKHIEEIKEVMPEADVVLVDGEMFSWYGSRLLKAIPYLVDLVKEK